VVNVNVRGEPDAGCQQPSERAGIGVDIADGAGRGADKAAEEEPIRALSATTTTRRPGCR
jgi:hypothetical protein